jgi:hypothetical protein
MWHCQRRFVQSSTPNHQSGIIEAWMAQAYYPDIYNCRDGHQGHGLSSKEAEVVMKVVHFEFIPYQVPIHFSKGFSVFQAADK